MPPEEEAAIEQPVVDEAVESNEPTETAEEFMERVEREESGESTESVETEQVSAESQQTESGQDELSVTVNGQQLSPEEVQQLQYASQVYQVINLAKQGNKEAQDWVKQNLSAAEQKAVKETVEENKEELSELEQLKQFKEQYENDKKEQQHKQEVDRLRSDLAALSEEHGIAELNISDEYKQPVQELINFAAASTHHMFSGGLKDSFKYYADLFKNLGRATTKEYAKKKIAASKLKTEGPGGSAAVNKPSGPISDWDEAEKGALAMMEAADSE